VLTEITFFALQKIPGYLINIMANKGEGNIRMTFRPHHCTVGDPKEPITPSPTLPNKISTIPSVRFVAFKCGVCVPNLSSLALKLAMEIEVTDKQTTPL